MTEQEWMESKEPRAMLDGLPCQASERKLRLFVSAFWSWQACRLRKNKRGPQPLLEAVWLAEGWADQEEGTRERRPKKSSGGSLLPGAPLIRPAWKAALHAVNAVQGRGLPRIKAQMIRDIFGNPFRSISLDPTWLTPTVRQLAQAAYDERQLPKGTLDPARLAVLADALEEAGCSSPEVLSHLHEPGPHVRGCWPVDLVLGRS